MTIAKRTGLKRKNVQRVIKEPKRFVNPLTGNYVLREKREDMAGNTK